MAPVRWHSLRSETFAPFGRENHDVYEGVFAAFAELHGRPSLTLLDIQAALRERWDDDQIRRVLRSLVELGHLYESANDQATFASLTDYERKNLRWSLTGQGQATIIGLDAAEKALLRAASLQPAAIDEIAAAVDRLADAVGSGDDDRAHVHFETARNHHDALVADLRKFSANIQDALRPDADETLFAGARDRIRAYIYQYVDNATAPASRVTSALARLTALGPDRVAESAVRGANLLVLADDEAALAREIAERVGVIGSLTDWFGDQEGAQFGSLLSQALDAVNTLLRAVELRWHRDRRRASLPDDLRALAEAFAHASQGDADRLAAHAFGAWPSRHLSDPAVSDTGEWPQAGLPPGANPAVTGTVVIRARRPHGTVRSGAFVPDLSALRRQAREEQARESRALASVRAEILTGAPVALSAFGRLSDEAFDELVGLVMRAATNDPNPQGVAAVRTSDGMVEVRLHPPLPAHATAVLTCSRGRLRLPDWRVHVVEVVPSDLSAVAADHAREGAA